MAYIHDIAVTTQSSTTAATYAMNMPDHAIGDLLVWYASADAGTLTPSGSTWTIIGTNPTSTTTNIIVSAAGYRVATTTTETLSLATSDVASCLVVCFKEVNATPFDVSPVLEAINTATSTPVGASQTSTVANTLHVSMIASAGANPMAVTGPGTMWAAMSDAGGTTDTLSAHNAIGWKFKRTAGAIPAINWINNLTIQYTRLTFTLRPSAGARIPPYIDGVALTPATLVHLGSYSGSTAINGTSTTTNGITATIAGKTATPATAATLADCGVDPYTSILTSASAATAATALVGPEITITTAMDFTGKLLIGTVNTGNWKQGKFGVGSIKQGGVVMRIGSGGTATTTWNAYQVAAKDAQVPPVTPTVFVIEPSYATTAYATGAGGNCSVSAVKYVQVLRNAPSFSTQAGLSECWMVDKQVVAGGDSTYPIDLNELVNVGKSFRLPLIQKAGASSVVFFAPIQLGGGDAIYFSDDSGVIQFPDRASVTKKDLQYHASDNKLGVYFSARSGDTCKLTNSVVTSPIPQIFEITTTATSAASWDFSGTTLVGMTVTLRPVVTFNSMTFRNCTFISFNVSTMSSCNFVGSGAVTADGSTFTNCQFNNSISTTGAYVITLAASTPAAASTELTTALSKLSSCQFTTNTTPAAALYINYTGSAGSISADISNVKFSGNTKDIYWNATNAGSNVTFNLTGGANPTTSTAVNGTVTFSQSNTFTVSNVVYNSEIRIYTDTGNPSTYVELAGVENIGVSSPSNSVVTGPDANGKYSLVYTHAYSSQPVIVIAVCSSDLGTPANSYQVFSQKYTIVNSTKELLITQLVDRNYDNPA